MVAALSAELAWELQADQQQTYVSALLQHLPNAPSKPDLRRLAMNYHQDHALVQALQDRANPRHEMVWAEAAGQVVRMVMHLGYGQAGEVLADVEELTQVAVKALIQALPTFHYVSRFSTWAYAVVGRSALRYLRELQAAKRHGRVESLEQHTELNELPAETEEDQPEARVAGRALAALIDAVLTERAGARLARIFHLSVHDELPLAEIGRQVHLSPSRVSVLLEQARQLLQESPELQAWLSMDDVDQASGAPTDDLARTK
jgi:RNA polymerase sigma factor (sigma-70 family)